ncbi:hypothetical protein MSG28_011967 [Choristoneura fumiferana]|uniref:Uncharacterized protein n=1 Tax=Choristoneura fumiferana TaxID=7141 RepID=A0ACC0KMI5_CHOFU|nr:hypothetical protein MSG28_011967 [Choristoneura fumiferana]
MEEKESIPENSTETVSLDSGDKDSSEKATLESSDSTKHAEDPQSSKLSNSEANELGDDDTTKSSNGNGQSENELSEKGDSELQNHVEHESDSVSDKVPGDVKEEINNEIKSEDAESAPTEGNAELQGKIESPEESNSQESASHESVSLATDTAALETSSQESADIDKPADTDSTNVETTKNETEDTDALESSHNDTEKISDVGKPEFETAPNVQEEPQEDHTQALDPFDALLKDRSNSAAETSTSKEAGTGANLDDDDDDHNVDGDVTHDDEEHTEEPGADEEVCLLPDTEREISEADKAEAAKVLAEKRKQAEEAETVPKTEHDADSEEVREDAAQDDVAADADEGTPHDHVAVFQEKSCTYRYMDKNNEKKYVCTEDCVVALREEHPGQYNVTSKKYTIEEIVPKMLTCSECEESKLCYFYYNYDGEDTHYCSLACLNSMMADEQDKYVYKRRRQIVEEVTPTVAECLVCKETKKCGYAFKRYGVPTNICDQSCIKELNSKENGRYNIKRKRVPRKQNLPSNPPLLKLKVISNATDKYLDEAYKLQPKTPAMVQAAREERDRTFIRKCYQCTVQLNMDDKNLTWETMDFCNEVCLGRYQNKIGARCANCKNLVTHTSLGKYCVRFGYDIRQFCNSGCLEEFKKGLKICCYCQRDISVGHQGFLAPVGDKGQFKDFCTQQCMEKFDQMSKSPMPQPVWAKCAVCSLEKGTTIEVEVSEDIVQRLCSDPCFAAFKFVNNIFPDQCRWCKKYFERKVSKCFTIYETSSPDCFCSKSCMNVYISNSRHIVPCNWCKVKKYNFDMIRRVQNSGQVVMMCSLNCLNLYQVSINAVSSRR